jgi:hypothetical protein
MAAKKKSKKKSPAKKANARTAPSKKAQKKKKASAKKSSAKKFAAKTSQNKQVSARRAKGTVATKKNKSAVKRAKSGSSYPLSRPARIPLTDDDAQGLSNAETADSESVSELVDEGNAFEAGVVRGVEEADDADEREVHTHEVSEDDVPEEYLDQD